MTEYSAQEQADGLTGILEAIEEVVIAARAMPMSSSVLVSRAELLALIEQARGVLPTQLTQADEVLADASAVIARARREAEAVLETAYSKAEALVAEQAVVAAAQERAAAIISDATEVSTSLRREADDYCDRRLADFEIDLGRVLGQVQAGRAKLAGRLAEPDPIG